MAKIKEDLKALYQTTKNGDTNERQFSAGDEVTVVQTWSQYYLVKDGDGHYFNISKDQIET